jgi:hypothetical protein
MDSHSPGPCPASSNVWPTSLRARSHHIGIIGWHVGVLSERTYRIDACYQSVAGHWNTRVGFAPADGPSGAGANGGGASRDTRPVSCVV